MKLPRDVGGEDLAHLLEAHGYRITRQRGSHLRLTSSLMGGEHHLSIPSHRPIKLGTLSAILSDVASYLEMDKRNLVSALFKKQLKISSEQQRTLIRANQWEALFLRNNKGR